MRRNSNFSFWCVLKEYYNYSLNSTCTESSWDFFKKRSIFLRNSRESKPVEGLDIFEKLSYMYIYP